MTSKTSTSKNREEKVLGTLNVMLGSPRGKNLNPKPRQMMTFLGNINRPHPTPVMASLPSPQAGLFLRSFYV